ncbi:MAG: hypothetical protein AAGJ08_00035 [Cyanobacteria bacterium P01_H01_bin.35]
MILDHKYIFCFSFLDWAEIESANTFYYNRFIDRLITQLKWKKLQNSLNSGEGRFHTPVISTKKTQVSRRIANVTMVNCDRDIRVLEWIRIKRNLGINLFKQKPEWTYLDHYYLTIL